jgi:hypothetical protein
MTAFSRYDPLLGKQANRYPVVDFFSFLVCA